MSYDDASENVASPTLSISDTASMTWTSLAPLQENTTTDALAAQWFYAVVPAGVTSTTFTCTLTVSGTTEQLAVAFIVDQITGQGSLGSTPNSVSTTTSTTPHPGARTATV